MSDNSLENKIWTKDFIFISLINLTAFTGFNIITTGMPLYVASLGANQLISGLVTTFTAVAALIIRPFTGIILDRFGRKGMLIVSTAAMALIILSYAIFPIISVILALRLFHGIAWGLGSTATSTIAADVIPNNRFAEGMGYFALATSLAVAVAPALSIAIIQSKGIMPVIFIAVIITVVSFILSLFQSDQKPIDESSAIKEKSKLKISDMIDKSALLPAGIMLLLNCSFASVTTFIALFGQSKGIDNIYLYFTVYAIVTIFSRPIIGKIIDKTGFFWPGVLSTIGVILTLVIIAFSNSVLMFCVAGIFAGLGFGTGMGTLQTMAVSSVSFQRRGVATSTYLFGFDAGMALGAAVAGAVASAVGYSNMYLIMAIFPAVACLVFIVYNKKRT